MNNLDTLIENGLVVTENEIDRLNIGIKDGKINFIGNEKPKSNLNIDASNFYVLPGGIDPHVHVDQPSGDDVIMADDFQSLMKDKELTSALRDLTIGISKFLNEVYP